MRLSKSISIKKIFVILLFILTIICENIILLFENSRVGYDYWLYELSIVVIINIMFTLFAFTTLRIRVISLSSFFILFSYLFHFGQVIIHGLFPDYAFTIIDAVGRYSKSVVDGLMFSLNIINLVTLFVMISSNSKKNLCKEVLTRHEVNYRRLRKLGYAVLAITFPVQLYCVVMQIVLSRKYYYATEESINGMLFQIGILSIIGFVLLVFGYSNDKKKETVTIILSCAWYVFTMISGSRIYAVISICILGYCYLSIQKNLNIYKMIIYMVLAVMFMGLLHSVMRVRTIEAVTVSAVLRNLFNSSTSVFLGTLEEFGGSFYTVKIGFEQIPYHIPYNFGKSYLGSFALAGINIGGILEPIMNNIAFTSRYTQRYSYGGSYIAELYYNFGWIALFIAPIWGSVLATISDKLNQYIWSKNFEKCANYVMVFYGYLLWIRGYANAMVRGVVWGLLLLWIVKKVMYVSSADPAKG